jgi:hypothetical protein
MSCSAVPAQALTVAGRAGRVGLGTWKRLCRYSGCCRTWWCSRSVSEITPTTLSWSSTTGSPLIRCSASNRATSLNGVSRRACTTSRVMTSLTLKSPMAVRSRSFRLGLLTDPSLRGQLQRDRSTAHAAWAQQGTGEDHQPIPHRSRHVPLLSRLSAARRADRPARPSVSSPSATAASSPSTTSGSPASACASRARPDVGSRHHRHPRESRL